MEEFPYSQGNNNPGIGGEFHDAILIQVVIVAMGDEDYASKAKKVEATGQASLQSGNQKKLWEKILRPGTRKLELFHNSGAPEGITQTKTKGSAPMFFS